MFDQGAVGADGDQGDGQLDGGQAGDEEQPGHEAPGVGRNAHRNA